MAERWQFAAGRDVTADAAADVAAARVLRMRPNMSLHMRNTQNTHLLGLLLLRCRLFVKPVDLPCQKVWKENARSFQGTSQEKRERGEQSGLELGG